MDNSISRFKAREQGFILVFEKIFHSEPIEEIISNAEESRDLVVDSYALTLVNGVYANLSDIDAIIDSNLKKGWTVKRISKTSLAILRLAVFEMKYVDNVPDSVAINEAVELAKKYTVDERGFINGVLGSVSKA
ncbi:MAG: transcription antitermination factor NusB [Ruminococcus sp.]|nr:transcription antitermination factor NusB [Ruminococcus sp.]